MRSNGNGIGMEQLPHHLIEEILCRVEDVEDLLRCTSVSKLWNSLIKAKSFAWRHLTLAESRNPHVLLGGTFYQKFDGDDSETYTFLKTWEIGKDVIYNIDFFSQHDRRRAITGSCDGLVCVYNFHLYLFVLNPVTRWSRSLPRAKIQQITDIGKILQDIQSTQNLLGFGKDTRKGEYKLVWLYNSLELGLDGHTTCEVFEFTTNTWRQVSGSPHRICDANVSLGPVYLDGSLHWFTEKLDGETKIIYFDMHTEVFQVMPEIPLVHASPQDIIMCSLNNRLCISEKKNNNSQEIWLLNPHKVWEKTYTLDLEITLYQKRTYTSNYCHDPTLPITPVACFDKTKLLLHYSSEGSYHSRQGYATGIASGPCFLVHDTKQGDYQFCFRGNYLDKAISYFPSLLSI